jgi:hypothetical protein
MIEVYGRLRPPASEHSRRVVVVRDAEKLSPQQPGVIFAATPDQPADLKDLRVIDHPITHDVDWPKSASVAPNAPADSTPIVSAGDRVLVAVRAQPARQGWVGFESESWPRSPAYVVFWTSVFDWVGQGGAGGFVGNPIGQLGPEWALAEIAAKPQAAPGLWPGLYRRADGALRAVNALDVQIPPIYAPGNWQQNLSHLQTDRTGAPLAPWLLLVALGCMLGSALTWRRRRRLTVISAPLTV